MQYALAGTLRTKAFGLETTTRRVQDGAVRLEQVESLGIEVNSDLFINLAPDVWRRRDDALFSGSEHHVHIGSRAERL